MLADLLCPPFHFPPGLLSGALNQSYGEICMAVRAAHVGFTLAVVGGEATAMPRQ